MLEVGESKYNKINGKKKKILSKISSLNCSGRDILLSFEVEPMIRCCPRLSANIKSFKRVELKKIQNRLPSWYMISKCLSKLTFGKLQK